MNERMSKKKEKHEKHFRVYGYLKIIDSALLSTENGKEDLGNFLSIRGMTPTRFNRIELN